MRLAAESAACKTNPLPTPCCFPSEALTRAVAIAISTQVGAFTLAEGKARFSGPGPFLQNSQGNPPWV